MKTTASISIAYIALAIQHASCFADIPNAIDALKFPSPASHIKRQSPSSIPPFDAKQQYVSTTGAHAFTPPGPNDARGPCPGLNAMANHNYLPHSGFATITEFVSACETVFGMGSDLATILSIYGGAFDGIVAGWSIAGTQHIGIGGSHNNYETDSSPLRADLNQYGSNTRLVMSQFHTLYNLQPNAASANYDLSVIKTFRQMRFNESIAKNPYFFYAPFSGAVVSQAAFSFIYRFMGNKSAEHPTGLLNKEVLKSFMSIQGPEDQLTWVPGHERIPDNWYTRNKNDSYTINYFSDDITYLSQGQEYISQPGCNTGKVNSYTPINITAMSGGTYPLGVTNPLCLGLEYAISQLGSLGVVSLALQEVVLPLENALGCVTVPQFNMTVMQACPGYSLYGGPTGKVAPGAVQH